MKQLFFALCLFGTMLHAQIELVAQGFLVEQQKTTFTLDHFDADKYAQDSVIYINETIYPIEKKNDKYIVKIPLKKQNNWTINWQNTQWNMDFAAMPLWLSILPPLLAIVLAIAVKEVLIALLLAIFIGLGILGYYQSGWIGCFQSMGDFILEYTPENIADRGHLSVILFCLLTGAMITIISKNGGMQGLVDLISRFAKNKKSVQFSTFFLGIVLFFDDYANSIIVGSTMRKVTDKFWISREKLAYLVDSTAAPISAIALITTWVGAVLQYIDSSVQHINATTDSTINISAYGLFVNSLQYSFYPIFTLIFILLLLIMGRDFGPMLQAERAAAQAEEKTDDKKLEEVDFYNPLPNIKISAINGLLPIFTLIGVTIFYLLLTGERASGAWARTDLGFFDKLQAILGSASSFSAILMGSFFALLVAILITWLRGIARIQDIMEMVVHGMKYIMSTLVILVLAWTIAAITQLMHTADFLIQITQNNIPVVFIPALTFLLASVTAFSTGTSWGTMAILYPLILPLTWTMALQDGVANFGIFESAIACVLAGAVLGDHISPISDTTILSSLATNCNHLSHVRTQLPYALVVGGVALCVGTIPSALGVSSAFLFPIGTVILGVIIYFFGKKTTA